MKFFGNYSIGITGGFASGKSAVAHSLAEIIGYCCFDADREVASLLKIDAVGWQFLRSLLGISFFHDDGELNKLKLRDVIFSDKILRHEIEHVLHPLVRESLKDKVDEAYLNNGKRSLVEVPLLYEAKWQNYFSLVVAVSVTDQEAIKRAVLRDGVTCEQAKMAISAQMPLKEKVLLADYVIDNDKSWKDTEKQLVELKINLDTQNLTA